MLSTKIWCSFCSRGCCATRVLKEQAVTFTIMPQQQWASAASNNIEPMLPATTLSQCCQQQDWANAASNNIEPMLPATALSQCREQQWASANIEPVLSQQLSLSQEPMLETTEPVGLQKKWDR